MTATYGDMQTRIADELARADLTAQIRPAIQSAIRHHERERFYFNEAIGTFATVPGQAWYGAADLAAIPDIVEIDVAKLAAGPSLYTLARRTIDAIEAADAATSLQADPTDYAYYRQQLRLWPTPSLARTVTLSYVQRLAALSADGDTNAWMGDAEELIRARAKADLFANVIRDLQEAAPMRELEAEALARLRAETVQRVTAGRLTATAF
jgi:hypothetical protein